MLIWSNRRTLKVYIEQIGHMGRIGHVKHVGRIGLVKDTQGTYGMR